LGTEKAFWANPENYTHFSTTYWQKELRKVGIDFSFFKDKSVCEIGCGPFGMIYYIDAKTKIGIDPLIPYYQELGLITDDRTKNITLLPCGGENLQKVASNSVDTVICYNVLDHVREPGKVLSEACRILKSNGTLFLNCHIVGTFLLPVRSVLKYIDPPHHHHFSKRDLQLLLNRCGFVINKEKKYRMTPALTSFKALAGRITMFHFSVLANKKIF
jgi:ubiquinone/menaquinone biosynthesis C-methylase UbiE